MLSVLLPRCKSTIKLGIIRIKRVSLMWARLMMLSQCIWPSGGSRGTNFSPRCSDQCKGTLLFTVASSGLAK
eukprot:313837-Amphidinium_carterae.1